MENMCFRAISQNIDLESVRLYIRLSNFPVNQVIFPAVGYHFRGKGNEYTRK